MADKRNFPNPFGPMASLYRNFRRKLPVVVSNMAMNEFKENFRRGGYREGLGVTTWKPRKVNPKGARRGILIKTGRLRRSFRTRPDYYTARVINNAPYAELHNEGGRIKGTVRVKSFRRRDGSRVRSHARRVDMQIPARPFMVTGNAFLDEVEKYVFNELDKIFK